MPDRKPMIDVIVPVYKTEPYLPGCVESLLSQDFGDYVITLVDDGSPDGCGALCDGYAAAHPGRVRVIHQENQGLSGARNTGVAASEAAYVTFVDSDDHVAENHLSVLYGALTEFGADLAVGSLCREYIQPDGSVRRSGFAPIERQAMDRDTALTELCWEQHFGGFACGKLLTRACALAHPFPLGRFFEDSFTVYRWFLHCDRVACVPEATYFYLQRPGSLQRHSFEPRHLDLIDAVLEMMDVFQTADIPPAVTEAGAYKVCRACYVTAFHAADLQYPDYRRVCETVRPALRRYYPQVRQLPRCSRKDRLVFRLLLTSGALFYAAVRAGRLLSRGRAAS